MISCSWYCGSVNAIEKPVRMPRVNVFIGNEIIVAATVPPNTRMNASYRLNRIEVSTPPIQAEMAIGNRARTIPITVARSNGWFL